MNGVCTSFFNKLEYLVKSLYAISSPEFILNLIEKKTNVESEIIAMGLLAIVTIYLVFGWYNDFLCNLVTFIYAVYKSSIAVLLSDSSKYLLKYWTIYSAMNCIEYFLHRFFDILMFYWLGKCIFLIKFLQSEPSSSQMSAKQSFSNFNTNSEVVTSVTKTINQMTNDAERYHEEIFTTVQADDVQRLTEILHQLDCYEPSTMKRHILNMVYSTADDLTALGIAIGEKHKSVADVLTKCPEIDINKASLSGITPLLLAAEAGWTDIIDILLACGAAVDAAPSGIQAEKNKIAGSTPLIGATKYNHPECVKRLLAYHANPNHQNRVGVSSLMLSAEQGYFECVKLLIEAGADLELAPNDLLALEMNLAGQTALFCAAKEGRLEIVQYLLDRGANPRIRNHYGVSILWIPAQRGFFEVVQLLLNAGTEIDVAPFGELADELNIAGWTPLYAAMKFQKYDIAKLLLQHGADSNAVTKLGSTPFLLASEICDLDIVKACIETGANLDVAPNGTDATDLNIAGRTALFIAASKDRVDIVKFLIEKGANVNVKNQYGLSPLFVCAKSGNDELVQVLVQAGANVNVTAQGELAEKHLLAGQTPLIVAAKKGHIDICIYLILHGADVNAAMMTGVTSLYAATEKGHFDVVQLLIHHGADIDRSPQGQYARELRIENETPLLVACMRNHEDIIRYLIKSGANVNRASQRGTSPFLAICQHDNVDLARLLILHGAQYHVETKNSYGDKINGLIVAIESNSFNTLHFLIESGLDINYKITGSGQTSGWTPLFCACSKDSRDIVKYLIANGADINVIDNNGLSCLHMAATMGYVQIVRMLCEHGANVNQPYHLIDNDVTAYELAESQQHTYVCEILKSFGAKYSS